MHHSERGAQTERMAILSEPVWLILILPVLAAALAWPPARKVQGTIDAINDVKMIFDPREGIKKKDQ